jgi:hypothetical protein
MTKKKIYLLSKERCACKILERLVQRPYEIAFPLQVEGIMKTMRSLPRAVSFPLIRWFSRKIGS